MITNDRLFAELNEEYVTEKKLLVKSVYGIDVIFNTQDRSLSFIDEKNLRLVFMDMCLRNRLRLAIPINMNVKVQMLDSKLHSIEQSHDELNRLGYINNVNVDIYLEM